jgi:hypothetical protein
MQQVECLHLLQVKAVEDIGDVFAHAAEVAAQEYPLAAEQGDTRTAILAVDLLALDRLDIESMQRGDDVLGFGIVAEDAHVGGLRPVEPDPG